ncbi:MAG: arginine--tRNA ligase, partial [Firmicutes bacterium]|nr:arginine--tRNA ligase [Bacillota bacterium]
MKDIKKEIAAITAKASGLTEAEALALIEIPPESSKGDYAFPCFRLAKLLRKAPPLIAADIAEKIRGNELFEKVENVNAYVNMFIDKKYFSALTLTDVMEKGDDYGRSDLGGGKTVIVEYSSPNIAKPFHIGHIRSTVIGNAIYKLYDAIGYKVIRINHLGDYGTQFGKMITAYR